MNPTITGHDLRRVSPDCHLCGCGFAIFGAKDDRAAQSRHSIHIGEIKRIQAEIRDAQERGIQSTLDDGPSTTYGGFNKFGQGVLK